MPKYKAEVEKNPNDPIPTYRVLGFLDADDIAMADMAAASRFGNQSFRFLNGRVTLSSRTEQYMFRHDLLNKREQLMRQLNEVEKDLEDLKEE